MKSAPTKPIISTNSQFQEKKNDTEHPNNNMKLMTWQTHQYTKLYNALKDLEAYDVKISIPEFVFIGFQSSGKTSAVSQAAKLALGVMKCGAASRCPTRFKLISNPNQKKHLISVNGELCSDNSDLTKKISEITNQYEQQGIFTKDIIEVRIESAQVPELTFVDLPGLIKADNVEFKAVKEQLDSLTAHFLCAMNPNGTYKYIPILVKEPVDQEHDTQFEVKYIDDLIEKVGKMKHYWKRKGWKDDTLFIVNKFDKQINRSPALSLIKYMEYCCQHGNTVLTMMNPTDENTANMGQSELNQFVLNVELLEEEKWSQVFRIFENKNDMDLTKLRALKQRVCGVSKMNEFLTDKMCMIVKKILPSIEQKLDLAEMEKKSEIDLLTIQCDLCDPIKLKDQCISFNNLFLQYLREFYAGINILQIDNKYKKSWYEEVNDFHIASQFEWKYEISPSKLEGILTEAINRKLKQKKISSKDIRTEIDKIMIWSLLGCPAIDRIISLWKCQVSCMPFPIYSDDDILNVYSSFDSTIQPPLWPSIRNIVLDAVSHLSDAARFLAEILIYKLKENAEIVFEYTLVKQFGTCQLSNDSIMRLLRRTLRDYKAEIDNIINEFVGIACVGPNNLAQVLDETFCEESINIGFVIHDKLGEIVGTTNDNYFATRSSNKPIVKMHKNQHLPKQSKSERSSSIANDTWFRYRPPQPIHLDTPSNDDNDDDKSDEKQMLFEEDSVIVTDKIKSVPDSESLDLYELIYQNPPFHPIKVTSNVYDIGLIRNLANVFWTNIKQITIRDTIQKLSNSVMAHIKQKDARIANAIQCGVGRQRLQFLIKQLVDITGIDSNKLEHIIKEESTIPIPKSVNDLNDTELQEICGIDRETLMNKKQEKIKQLQEYKKLKEKILMKIYHIKNNQFDKIPRYIDSGDTDEKEENPSDNYTYYCNNIISNNAEEIVIDEESSSNAKNDIPH